MRAVTYGVVLAVWLSLAPAFLAESPSDPATPGRTSHLHDFGPRHRAAVQERERVVRLTQCAPCRARPRHRS